MQPEKTEIVSFGVIFGISQGRSDDLFVDVSLCGWKKLNISSELHLYGRRTASYHAM